MDLSIQTQVGALSEALVPNRIPGQVRVLPDAKAIWYMYSTELGADTMPTLLNIFGPVAASSQFVRIDSEECVLAADAKDVQAATTVVQPSPIKKPNCRKAANVTQERTDVLSNQHKRITEKSEIQDFCCCMQQLC